MLCHAIKILILTNPYYTNKVTQNCISNMYVHIVYRRFIWRPPASQIHNNNPAKQFVSMSHRMTVVNTVQCNCLLCFIIWSATNTVEFIAGMFSACRDEFSFLSYTCCQMLVSGGICCQCSNLWQSHGNASGQYFAVSFCCCFL